MRVSSIVNPLSADYHCWETFKNELTAIQKVMAVAAAILCSIIPVIGTTFAFRKVVLHFNQQAQLEKEWNQSDKIRLDRLVKLSDKFTLVKKLCALGIGPSDSPFMHLWIVSYLPSNANTLYGPEAQAQFPGSQHAEIQRECEQSTGLFIFMAHETQKKELERFILNSPKFTQLTVDQVCLNGPLPETFIDLVKNGFASSPLSQ